MIEEADALRPIYKKTAAYGHFGRNEAEFTWEKTDKVEILKAICRTLSKTKLILFELFFDELIITSLKSPIRIFRSSTPKLDFELVIAS